MCVICIHALKHEMYAGNQQDYDHYTHTDIHTYIHTHIHKYTHTYMSTHLTLLHHRMPARNLEQTYRHTYTHTDIHTHIHTCIHTCLHTSHSCIIQCPPTILNTPAAPQGDCHTHIGFTYMHACTKTYMYA